LIRIWILHFRLNTDPDQAFLCPKNGKNLQLKKKLIKTTIYLSLGLQKDVQVTRVADSWVCGSGSGFGIGSGSRRAKMTHKSRKKFVKVYVLKCWMASFES
jgi:hypothetical protein